jgi:capsular polysaccharide biosynthesis protein
VNDEFDFRPYIKAILQRRHWLVVGALVAGLLAFGFSCLVAPTYRANALVLIADPNQLLQFDPRIESIEESRPLPAYPVLATSDAVLQELLREIRSAESIDISRLRTMKELRMHLSVAVQDDPSLLQLTVELSDPESAARIANSWAGIFITRTNMVIGDQGDAQVQLYMNLADQAHQELEVAEEALTMFQAGNRMRIVAARIVGIENRLAGYLEEQRAMEAVGRDAASLQAQLTSRSGDPVPVEQLAVELLYLRTFGDESTLPIELQINTGSDENLRLARDQLLVALEGLQKTVQANISELEAEMSELEPELLALQEEKQRLNNEQTRLTQTVSLATEAYTTLTRQLSGEELLSQDTSRGLRLASPAVRPEEPVSPLKLVNAALAAVVAFILIMAAIVIQKWWEGGNSDTGSDGGSA